jgi:hypothetical protein
MMPWAAPRASARETSAESASLGVDAVLLQTGKWAGMLPRQPAETRSETKAQALLHVVEGRAPYGYRASHTRTAIAIGDPARSRIVLVNGSSRTESHRDTGAAENCFFLIRVAQTFL